MRNITLCIVAILLCHSLQAQNTNGTIKGTVTTSDNKPAAWVTILIKENKRTTLTDEAGNFILSKLAAGNYQLEISLTGYQTLLKEVSVAAGATQNIALQLQVSEKQLVEVTVTSGRNRFAKTGSDYVAKMPLKNLENPQVYTTVTQPLLQDQLNTAYADALKNVPGVVMQLENNSAGGTVTSRGFSTQSFLRNGVPGIVGGGTIDPANIESIEAIKGPSGALYGGSLASFGGLFNRVTKKPLDDFSTALSYTGGGYGLSRLSADINTPLNKEKDLLLRINAVKYNEGSFQDAGFKSYVFLAPVVTYQLSDKTTLTLEGEYKNEKANSFYRLFADGSYATGVRSPRNLKMDFNKRFSSDDIYVTTATANVYGELKHRLSEHWQSQTNYTYLTSNAGGSSGYLSMKAGNDSLIRNMTYTEYSNTVATDFQENIQGDFTIGALRNRLLIGVDMYSVATKSSAPGTIAFDVISAAKPGTAYSALNRVALLDRVKGLSYTRSKSLQNTYSAYVQDVLTITPKLLALTSLRVDYFDNRGTKNITKDTTTGIYHQTAISPKFGLVYALAEDKLSLFANYTNGFQNIAPVLQPDGTTSSFQPSQANQWEAGVKVHMAGGRLSGSVSYYDIKVSDVTRADAPARPTYTIQNGTQYSKGIEADITAMPFAGLHIVAGYAYNDSKLEKSSPTLDGFRPISAGPAHVANCWMSYHISSGKLNGAGIGVGGNYSSDNKVILSTTSLYALPAYTVLGASLSYDKPRYRLQVKMDNLTNEHYWVGWSTTIPQMPARFSAAATLKL